MSSLQIGRLIVGPPTKWNEQIGDPITNLGGAVVPMVRTALRHAVSLPTLAADGATDTVAARLDIRRAMRSMLNNTELKLRGYFYVQYSDDPDQNGWYIPDQGQFADGEGSSGLATGWWVLDNVNWAHVGHLRTNREARNVWLKDLRTGLSPRDALELILSTDFAALPAVATTIFPHGATRPINTLTAAVVTTSALSSGRDGGACSLATGLSDLACIAYDRAETAMNLSDVIAYDRRGQITAPTTGPDTNWRETYGPDYPWNWLTSGQPNDAPVLDNGLCRVRYDAAVGSSPGFRVEVWNGTAYVEQGKVTFNRIGDVLGPCDTFLAASLHLDNGYTPDRAVVSLVLSNSADVYSRERIYITMQRGIVGCTFECYPAPKADQSNADATISWTPATADANNSVIKVDSQTQPPPAGNGKINASAGSGSAALPNGFVGNSTFATSENYMAMLRCSTVQAVTPYQVNIGVVQSSALSGSTASADTTGYGVARNIAYVFSSNNAGYVSADISFTPTVADQVMEAESMTLGTNTTAGGASDASNGAYTQSSRVTDANLHVSKPTWPNGRQGVYRVFARVKNTATQMSIYAKTGATTGTTRTVAGAATPTYAWVDLGDITANNTTLEIHAWVSSGSGIVEVDRIEAYLLTERVSPARYSGARDLGQTVLYDARQLGAVVAR